MKKFKKFISLTLSCAMVMSLCVPALAVETRDRFTYYTVTDPDWTYSQQFTITAEESKKYVELEERIWDVLSEACDYAIADSGDYVDLIADFIRENNLDSADAGTYTFYYKNKIYYKEHMLTGDVTVRLRKRIVRLDFYSSEKTNSTETTFTLR